MTHFCRFLKLYPYGRMEHQSCLAVALCIPTDPSAILNVGTTTIRVSVTRSDSDVNPDICCTSGKPHTCELNSLRGTYCPSKFCSRLKIKTQGSHAYCGRAENFRSQVDLSMTELSGSLPVTSIAFLSWGDQTCALCPQWLTSRLRTGHALSLQSLPWDGTKTLLLTIP